MTTACVRMARNNSRIFKFAFKNFPDTKVSKLNFSSRTVVNLNLKYQQAPKCRYFSLDSVRRGAAARAETTTTIQGLSKLQAQELVLRLTTEERSILISALQEYQSKLVKDEYEGKLSCS